MMENVVMMTPLIKPVTWLKLTVKIIPLKVNGPYLPLRYINPNDGNFPVMCVGLVSVCHNHSMASLIFDIKFVIDFSLR